MPLLRFDVYLCWFGSRYCAAFYFAIVTLTSVGYGDVHPQNGAERVYLIIVIMVGALLYGYFIGNMTQLTVKHDANFLKISAKMDHVASYVKSSGAACAGLLCLCAKQSGV